MDVPDGLDRKWIVTTEVEADLREETRFLRGVIDELVSEYDIPWIVILNAAQRYRAQTTRTGWLLTYLMSLQTAARPGPKPRAVLMDLTIGPMLNPPDDL